MKATYLRIKDSVISVTDQQKPDNWHRNGPPDFISKEEAIVSFENSFIEVSNPDLILKTQGDFTNGFADGLYPLDGLEFELKSISDRKTGREETFRVYQVAILSLCNTSVEPKEVINIYEGKRFEDMLSMMPFITWYSGMTEKQIWKGYERYAKEVLTNYE